MAQVIEQGMDLPAAAVLVAGRLQPLPRRMRVLCHECSKRAMHAHWLTQPDERWSTKAVPEVASMSVHAGFESVGLACWPQFPQVRAASSLTGNSQVYQ